MPHVCLVDPFPDPDSGAIVAEGAVVDADRGEIWIVATAEAPPVHLERALAMFFGASLPAAADLTSLIEGYGLHLAGADDPNPTLEGLPLPPLDTAEPDLRSLMALSFVRFLVAEHGVDSLARFLASARPGQCDAAAEAEFGQSLGALEATWSMSLMNPQATVPLRRFLALSLQYLKPYKVKQVEIFFWALVGLAFVVLLPLVTRQLFDKVLLGPDSQFSDALGLLAILGVGLVASLLGQLRGAYVTAQVSSLVVRQMRSDFFERLQRLPMPWYARHQQGDVLSRLLNDISSVEQGLTQVVREGVVQVVTLMVTAGMLVYLDPLLGVITLLMAPAVAIVYRKMSEGARRRSMAVEQQTGVVADIAIENYDAQPVVKAFNLEGREIRRFNKATERLFGGRSRSCSSSTSSASRSTWSRVSCVCSSWASGSGSSSRARWRSVLSSPSWA